MSQPQQGSNVVRAFLVTALAFFAIGYGVIAWNANNLLWFLSTAELSAPLRIVINDRGERIAFTPEDPEFEPLAEAIAASVSELNNSDLLPIGLSEQTLADYDSQFVVMEVHYSRPIEFNTSFRAGEPSNLLIPITGRHAGDGIFFRGERGEWWYGGLRMADPEPLYEELRRLCYQPQRFQPGAGS